MKTRILLLWTLLFGVALIAICGGMQGTLLGIRGRLEGFSVASVGIIMSAYYAGFLIGAPVAPMLVRQVGHIRVFAALASLGSVATLIYSTFIDPLIWSLLRLSMGFCVAGMFIVAESWLNNICTNENRGRLLSVYMFTVTSGFAGGQLLIIVSPATGHDSFILASVLLSIATIPILLSNISAPVIAQAEYLKLGKLLRITSLGSVAIFIQGITFSSLMWMTPVFGVQHGFSASVSALLVGTMMLGGLASQLPVGRLSDRQDRRHTLLLLSLVGAGAGLLAPLTVDLDNYWPLAVILFVVGAAVQPFYSVAASHLNDHLRSEQILSASGSIILISGSGGLLGPLVSSQTMSAFGPDSLYYFVALAYGFMALFALYRISVRPPIAVEEQSPAMAIGLQTSQVVIAQAMDETDQGSPLAPEEASD